MAMQNEQYEVTLKDVTLKSITLDPQMLQRALKEALPEQNHRDEATPSEAPKAWSAPNKSE
jgi:hypothetical protein